MCSFANSVIILQKTLTLIFFLEVGKLDKEGVQMEVPFLLPKKKPKLSLSSQSTCLTTTTELMQHNVQVDDIFVIIPSLPMQPSLSPTLHVSSAGPGH